MRTADQWKATLVGLGCTAPVATRWAPVFAAEIRQGTFSKGDDELDDFLGQIMVESGKLTHIIENLYYSTADRLCAVWPKRFPTIESTLPYVGSPEALANYVYGGRMGNSAPGDGWKYRGRGLIQVTGRDNYAALGPAIKLDVVNNPDLLADATVALRASIAWWEKNIPDSVMGNISRVTKLVNGGDHGIADRKHLTDIADTLV